MNVWIRHQVPANFYDRISTHPHSYSRIINTTTFICEVLSWLILSHLLPLALSYNPNSGFLCRSHLVTFIITWPRLVQLSVALLMQVGHFQMAIPLLQGDMVKIIHWSEVCQLLVSPFIYFCFFFELYLNLNYVIYLLKYNTCIMLK